MAPPARLRASRTKQTHKLPTVLEGAVVDPETEIMRMAQDGLLEQTPHYVLAQQLGISGARFSQLAKKARANLPKPVREEMTLDLHYQYKAGANVFYQMMLAGDVQAAKVWCRLVDGYKKLWGLDSPVKIQAVLEEPTSYKMEFFEPDGTPISDDDPRAIEARARMDKLDVEGAERMERT